MVYGCKLWCMGINCGVCVFMAFTLVLLIRFVSLDMKVLHSIVMVMVS